MPEREDSTVAASAVRRVGTTVRGKYHLDRLLGIGGMAAVYAATHRNGRRYALKILHADMNGDARRRFLREAKLANRVAHEGAIHVIDEDVGEEGCPFLVLPLLEGETLRARWERNQYRLPLDEVLSFAWLVLDVLASAHAKSLVHRDIKPENLFLTTDGELRVLDFGIARVWEGPEAAVSRMGNITGTPAFMAPEQVLGRVNEIDGRTDLWAVGATIFTLLSGQHVHEGVTQNEILVAAGSRPARNLAEVVDAPADLCSLVSRALAFDAGDRWPDARAMRAALDECATSCFGVAVANLAESVRRDLSRRPMPPAPRASFAPNVGITEAPGPASARLEHAPWHGEASLGSLRRAITRTTPFDSASRLVHTLTLRVLSPTHKVRTIWRGVGALALVGASILGVVRLRHTSNARENPPDPAARSASLDKHLDASRKAWLAGDFDRARSEAREASHLDDVSAEAHLAWLRTGALWPIDSDRAHFAKAQDSREQLTPSEREFLDAMAPAMSLPPDFGLSAQRLELLHKRIVTPPLEVTISLADMWLRIGRAADSAHLLESIADAADAPAIALAEFGAMQEALDDVDSARSTFLRCIHSFPSATQCISPLAQLELNEGRCNEAERLIRQEMRSGSRDPAPHLLLAYALEAQHSSISEVRPVLDRWATLSDAPGQHNYALRADIRLSLVQGRLREALALEDKLGAALAGSDSDDWQFDYTLDRMLLQSELGMAPDAHETLEAYRRARHEFRRDTYGGDNVMYLNAVATQLKLLAPSEWTALREVRVSTHMDRDDLADGRQRTWLEFYAMPATTTHDALEALAVLPGYLPILNRSERWLADDDAIGNVFALAGREREAEEYFERARDACTELEEPIQKMHVLAHLAAIFERQGRLDQACKTYETLLGTWPASSGSLTSLGAEQHFALLHCQAKRVPVHSE